MQFIRLSTLQNQFPAFRLPLAEKDRDAFRTAFYESALSRANGIHENEQWIGYLGSHEYVLFMDWVEQEESIAQLLEGRLVPFRNRTRLTEHAWFPHFQAFITPFLYPSLNELLKNSKLADWQNGLSYLPLLQEREADLVQNTVFEQLKMQYEALSEGIKKAKNEEQLQQIVRSYLSPELVKTLNLFTPSFYRLKTAWIEILKRVAHHPAGTKRLVLYLINELKPLQLNPNHQKELREAEREIRIGAVKVENAPVPWKKIVFFSIAGVLGVVLILVIFLLPAEAVHDKPQEQTAFMDFTVQERKTIDSLLQHIKMERQRKEGLDNPDLDYVGEELVVKIPWLNQDAEYILSSWAEKDTISRKPDPSFSKKEKRPFPMTELLSEKNGSIRAKFQNDTELSVLVMVFKNREDEWVYSQYIEKGAIASFKLYPDEHMIVVPGSKVPEYLNPGGLPFEQVDSRFFEHLENDYIVDDFSPSSVKFVWKALNNFDFYLLDVNGALNK